MDSLAILIPIALLLSLAAILAFVWAVKSDQFEDLERHGQDPLFDAEEEKTAVAQRKDAERSSLIEDKEK